MRIYFRSPNLASGFSLVEMAVVLVILGFVLAALMLPLQAQRGQLQRTETENTLEIARKALIGYAQANGRLPCPATITSSAPVFPDGSGTENPLGGGSCVWQAGFLPAVTLGIQPTDAQGFVIDGWNNRIRYAVTQAKIDPIAQTSVADNSFTTISGMSNAGISNLNPSLRVCNSASASALTCSKPITATTKETNYLINNAAAVIFSTGATAAQGAGGADENANLNTINVFVSRGLTVASPTSQEFDHIVIWISPFILYNAMIEAGQLH